MARNVKTARKYGPLTGVDMLNKKITGFETHINDEDADDLIRAIPALLRTQVRRARRRRQWMTVYKARRALQKWHVTYEALDKGVPAGGPSGRGR